VKIIEEPSETRNAIFKVIISNTEIAITPPQIARLRSNVLQSNITSQSIHCKCSRSKVNTQDHRVKVKATASSNVSGVAASGGLKLQCILVVWRSG